MREARVTREQRIQFVAGTSVRVIFQRFAAAQHEHHDERCNHFANQHSREDRGDSEDVDTEATAGERRAIRTV